MAASSSTMLFRLREEEQNQMKQQQQHSTAGPSSSAAVATPPVQKKRRNQPGTPNPDAEVIALSPKTLMATNRFICEVCNKGFQREQNLQLHRRGHNLPWKLRQKTTKEVKRKVYLCPDPTCVHHDPTRALGDLTGIKKHFFRKHGEKKFKCEKCSKKYAVQSDWKAHSKTCGTREYKCDCGTLFSRRDSFVTHRAFCDALAQESARQAPPALSSIGTHLYGNTSSKMAGTAQMSQDKIHIQPFGNIMLGLGRGARTGTTFGNLLGQSIGSSAFQPAHALSSMPFFMQDESKQPEFHGESKQFHGLAHYPELHSHDSNPSSGGSPFSFLSGGSNNNISNNLSAFSHYFTNGNANGTTGDHSSNLYSNMNESHDLHSSSVPSPHMSATALLQKAAQLGTTSTKSSASLLKSFGSSSSSGTKSGSFGGIFGESSGGQNFHELINSIAGGGSSSIFGSGSYGSGMKSENEYEGQNGKIFVVNLEQQRQSHQALGFGLHLDQNQVHHQNLASVNVGAAGPSDGVLTRDFLGVGSQIIRTMSGGISQQQQHGGNMDVSALDPDKKTARKGQVPFGGGGNFQ